MTQGVLLFSTTPGLKLVYRVKEPPLCGIVADSCPLATRRVTSSSLRVPLIRMIRFYMSPQMRKRLHPRRLKSTWTTLSRMFRLRGRPLRLASGSPVILTRLRVLRRLVRRMIILVHPELVLPQGLAARVARLIRLQMRGIPLFRENPWLHLRRRRRHY